MVMDDSMENDVKDIEKVTFEQLKKLPRSRAAIHARRPIKPKFDDSNVDAAYQKLMSTAKKLDDVTPQVLEYFCDKCRKKIVSIYQRQHTLNVTRHEEYHAFIDRRTKKG